MNWARASTIDPTDVNTYNDVLNAYTDVIVRDGYYSGVCGLVWKTATSSGVIGVATCNSLSGSSCEQHVVMLSQYYTDVAALDGVQGLAAHEAGHTLGLMHRTSGNTVMRATAPWPSRYYDSHDVAHLNAAY